MSTRFLTIADVSEQLQLSSQAVRALIRSGDLPAIQVGARKLWRIEDQALEDYIQRQLASTRGHGGRRLGRGRGGLSRPAIRPPLLTRPQHVPRAHTLHVTTEVSGCAAPRSPQS